jgi:hypothetical protein
VLCGFTGTRNTDRRLKILCDNGYLKKQKLLYGIPSLYTLTHQAKVLLNVSRKAVNISLARLSHHIAVLDTVVYLVQGNYIKLDEIQTEREMFSADGFGKVKHRPDFIHIKNDIIDAYEIELTLKAKDRFHKNVRENYKNYHRQVWIVPEKETEIFRLLSYWQTSYNNIDIVCYEVITGER